MPGLGSKAGGGSRFAPPAQTPPPRAAAAPPAPVRSARPPAPPVPSKPTATPARFVAPQSTPPSPVASPLPARSAVPGRASMQFKPPEPRDMDEVELTPAANGPSRPKKFDAGRVSASWIGGQEPEPKKSPFGLVGLIAAAAVLAGLVFLGVKLLVLDK